MVFDSIRRALGGSDSKDADEAELTRVRGAMTERQAQLVAKRESRLDALFPEGPVEGAAEGHFPGIDPVNLIKSDEEIAAEDEALAKQQQSMAMQQTAQDLAVQAAKTPQSETTGATA